MDIIVTNKEELEAAIAQLKIQKAEQKDALSAQFKETYQSFMPMNILKSAVHKAIEPGELRSTLLKAAGGIGAGLLTKGLLNKTATTATGSFLNKALKAGATTAILKNTDKIKAYGIAIYHQLFKGKS